MKKIHFGMLGIALVGVLSIGANSSFTNQALNIGETGGAPARPDYISFNKRRYWWSTSKTRLY